jgi:hypothetical protein
MARTVSSLDLKSIALATAYLKRALQREDTATFVLPGRAAVDLAKVEALMERVGPDHAPGQFRLWVIEHISNAGRVKMLNALRQKKADAKPKGSKRRTISVSASTFAELEDLRKKTGVPLPKLLASLAAIGNVDKELQRKIPKLAIALSMK